MAMVGNGWDLSLHCSRWMPSKMMTMGENRNGRAEEGQRAIRSKRLSIWKSTAAHMFFFKCVKSVHTVGIRIIISIFMLLSALSFFSLSVCSFFNNCYRQRIFAWNSWNSDGSLTQLSDQRLQAVWKSSHTPVSIFVFLSQCVSCYLLFISHISASWLLVSLW